MRPLLAAALALVLAGCGNASVPSGGRPALPSGIEVRHPAAPSNTYLSLVVSGQSLYQQAVKAGSESTLIESTPGPSELTSRS
ncbi:hypothetical protein ACFP81_09580 [Deinococcus lacus]|uniref:Uncharacterized protein n=1 Tax=Deinococcus lacus TaxID=392561 RepID=A0ABW1YDP6_9DEIO